METDSKTKQFTKAYHTLIPYINVDGAAQAIEFYKKAFGAKETGRIMMPDGSIGRAEITIGDSRIMIAEENAQWGNKAPKTLGGTPVCLCIYVEDVDRVFAQTSSTHLERLPKSERCRQRARFQTRGAWH